MMKNKKTILFIIVLFLLFACGISAGLFYFSQKTVTVTVVDAQSKQPVMPAEVAAENIPVVNKGDSFEVILAGYELGLMPTLNVLADAPGYRSTETAVFIPWWRWRQSAEINLEPLSVSGQVLDAETDAPLAALIRVTQGGESSEIVADSNGNFTVSHLAPPAQLIVEADGYRPWQTELDAATLADEVLQLHVDLSPQHLMGTVTDSDTGDMLAASILITDSQSVEQEIAADSEGQFEAMHLVPPVTVLISSPGYRAWQTEIDSSDLVTGNPAYKLDVQLEPRVTRGFLMTEDNDPMPGFTISAGSGEDAQTITTDADGGFELYRLKAGDLISVPSPNGYLPLEITFNNEEDLNLALQPRQVMVSVRDDWLNQPLPGVQVSFDTSSTATDAQGVATLTHIPAVAKLSVTAPGYEPIVLDYNEETELEITLSPQALQGIVRAADTGEFLPQATIYVGQEILRADDAGHFNIDIPATTEPLMIKSAGYHRSYADLTETGISTDGEPPFSGVEGRWVSVAPCADAPVEAGPPCVDLMLEPFEVKGIYVSMQYLHQRETILQFFDFIQATELNAIVIDIKSDYGLIAWDSDVALAQTIGAETKQASKNWMRLEEFIAEAKKRNIYTIGRFVVFKDHPLASKKPELGAVREDGTVWIDGEDLAWANPFKEEVWDYDIALAKEAADYGFDEINFDYIRFPSDGDVGAIVYEEVNTLETRTAAIREFFKRLTDELRPSGIFVSADVFGLTIWVRPDSDMKIGQRVDDIAPVIDYLAPMVYPSTFIKGNLGYDNPSAEPYGIVYRSQKQAEERVPPYVKVRPWLQGYWYSLDEMKELKQAAIDSNATGWVWWNAGGKYDSDLFDIAEETE